MRISPAASTTDRELWIFLLLAVICVISVPAAAGAPAADDSDREGDVPEALAINEEIVVTARRRDESLQSTPIAITTFSEESIAERSIRDLSDLGDHSPNLDISRSSGAFGGSSEATVFIRGIGQIDTALFTDPGVGIYVDGVYLARAQGAVLDLLDLERVEILRGPQGTLFGRNTIGGALRLITQKPNPDPSARIELTLGELDRLDAQVRLNGPLRKNLSGSLVLASTRHDGITQSRLTGERFHDDDREHLRGALRYFPSSRLIIDVAADYVRERERAMDSALVAVDGSVPLLDFYNQAVEAAGGIPLDERFLTDDLRRTFSTGPNQHRGDVWGTSLTLQWDLESFDLTSISAYRTFEYFLENDSDGSPADLGRFPSTQRQHQFSQEIQATGSALEGKLEWVAGALYFEEDAGEDLRTFLLEGLFEALEAAPGPIFAPPGLPDALCDPQFPGPRPPCFGGPGNPLNLAFFNGPDGTSIRTDINNESAAIFGEATYALQPRLELSAGLRFTAERKEFEFLRRRPLGPEERLFNEDDWSELSPRLNLAYHPNESLLLYASLSRGFKSGGFNGRPQDRGELVPFDEEKVWTWEIGAKSDLWGRRLRLNGALFFNDYSDLQLSAALEIDGEPVFVTQNAGEAEILGAELEFVLQPTERFVLSGGAGYTDSEYTELRGIAPDGAALDGTLPKTPQWDIHVSARYGCELAGARLDLRGDFSYKSRFFNNIANSLEVAQEAFGLFNARLAYLPEAKAWEIFLAGRNLTDEEYLEHGFAFQGFGFSTAFAGRPRAWTAGIRLTF